MVWSELEELQYYNQTPGIDCFCDLLIEANDLILQAIIPQSPTGQYNLLVEVMQPDGLIVFEDATQYFEWYVFQGVNGIFYMNMRAIRFSPAMCQNSCFILRVTISQNERGGNQRVTFQKYTERYCIDNCCIVAKQIDITPQSAEGLRDYSVSDFLNDDYLAG